MMKKKSGKAAAAAASPEHVYPIGKILQTGMMEKCSDGKRAKSGKSLGNMTAKWDARFVVMSRAGVWWYKTEEDFKAKEQASGCMLELASAEINYDESFQWMQFISPERILSIRPVDRYEDLRLWISSLGNKGNTNSGKRITKLPDQPTEWEDFLGHEFGMVTSDLGCSFHGVIAATGGLNDDDMIGYLSKGDALQLVSWPEHTVVIDRYGYPNVCVKVTTSVEGGYQGQTGYCELKACTF